MCNRRQPKKTMTSWSCAISYSENIPFRVYVALLLTMRDVTTWFAYMNGNPHDLVSNDKRKRNTGDMNWLIHDFNLRADANRCRMLFRYQHFCGCLHVDNLRAIIFRRTHRACKRCSRVLLLQHEHVLRSLFFLVDQLTRVCLPRNIARFSRLMLLLRNLVDNRGTIYHVENRVF